MVRFKNHRGSAELTCPNCGTWLAHWAKLSGLKASICAVDGCRMSGDIVGAPVRKAGDSAVYIVPLCRAHNANEGEMLAEGYAAQFQPASVAKSCGK